MEDKGVVHLSHLRVTSRMLYAVMAVIVAVPIGFFTYFTVVSRSTMHRETEVHIGETLDLLAEHSLKVFHTSDLLLQSLDRLTADLSDAEIRAQEPALHAKMKSIARTVPDVQSLWIVGHDGKPMVSDSVSPMPATDLSDRDYFRAFLANHLGVYVGVTSSPRVVSGAPFFTVSRRQSRHGDGPDRLIDVSLLPSDFTSFFSHLQREKKFQYSLIRADGAVLARFPAPAPTGTQVAPDSALLQQIAQHPAGGITLTPEAADTQERLAGYRKLDGYPAYVVVGIDTAKIDAAWMRQTIDYLLFRIPAIAVILTLLVITTRRTERMHSEAEARRAAETALARAQRLDALGQLTGGVAHDFNNLLMIISGSVEFLRLRIPASATTRATLDDIVQAVQRGESLTRQLLTFSRRQALNTTVIDVRQTIVQFRSVIDRSLRGDIELSMDAPSEAMAAKLDQSEFELALLNLAVNARDAMPRGGRIVFAVRPVHLANGPADDGLSGAFISVSVTDTGTGIAPDVLRRVFEPFFTTKEVGKGTGLGLSQVYGFARQSGGSTRIESVLGQGTTVTILVPRTDAPPDAIPSPAPATAEPAADRQILLVEDNDALATVTRKLLERFGYQVTVAAYAQAALDRLEAGETFDVVLSDIVMPGAMNGIDLARLVRRLHPSLPLVLTTGYSQSADEAIQDGFVILRKPYKLKQLREALAQAEGQSGSGGAMAEPSPAQSSGVFDA